MNIVLYDGDCGFCNFWVQWILKHDKQKKINFASLQSNYGQKFLKNNNYDLQNLDTVFYETDNTHFSRLDAVAEIGRTIGGAFGILGLLKLIPNFIGDPIYNIISKNRKALGMEACLLPTPDERKRFIND